MRKALEKIKIFRKFFTGLTHVYGTYDPENGHAWQVKEPATNDTILAHPQNQSTPLQGNLTRGGGDLNRFSLPICAQKMLQNGVSRYQRVSCFRLAVHLKRLGLPFELTVSALKTWALKNQPNNGKGVITEREIIEQTKCAFNKDYRGFGCNSEAVAPFCDSNCPIQAQKNGI